MNKLDFEPEFGAILGKNGNNISREKAREHIYGYCIFNDMSARDAQYRGISPARLGPAKGKDFDTGNVMGPWLVTADEVGSPRPYDDRACEWRGMGDEATPPSMYHKSEDTIAHVSSEETRAPG